MVQNFPDDSLLKRYLLGELTEEEATRLEERLMTEDILFEHLEILEDELCDDYLDNALNDEEKMRFERYFLAAPERQSKLKFNQTLRRRLKQNNLPEEKPLEQPKKSRNRRFDFSAIWLKAAALVLLALGTGFAVWLLFLSQSEADKGEAELRAAYQNERPFQSRLSNFPYAPFSTTRGDGQNNIDPVARDRAARTLLDAARDEPGAQSYQSLGRFYLTDKQFEKAIAQFEAALRLDPNNAQIHNDLGAAYLEIAERSSNDGAKRSESLDKGLKHLEEAIKLDPQMLEARFNYALGLEAILPERAKQAWREYLRLDPNSRWAEEARGHLQTLESQKNRAHSAAELENDFLNVFRQKDENTAWQLLSRNRELIREKYLPQRLAMSLLEASGEERKNILQALEYAGQLEKNRIGDAFASEIAEFYARLPSNKHDLLKKAQGAVRNGYRLCLESKYTLALDEFNLARDLFSQVGDFWEEKLAEYFIAYCLQNNSKIEKSLTMLNELLEFCRERKYKWLELTVLHWVANNYVVLHRYTQAKIFYEKTLSLAEQINDSYAVQRNLAGLATISSQLGDNNQALNHVQKLLRESRAPENSSRQIYRNYQQSVRVFTASKLNNLAKAVALEAVSAADETKDPLLIVLSRNYIGNAYIQAKDYDNGRKMLAEAFRKAEMMEDEVSKKRTVALALLRLAVLERQTENYEKALEYSDRALNIYETIDFWFYLFETHKERLLAYYALGKKKELEEQIPLTLEIFERNRGNILEIQERTSFFESEQRIYEIAVDYEIERGRSERAYNYAENSNSRSLLDWLVSAEKFESNAQSSSLSAKNVKPFDLSEIRRRMPSETQILQYSVLENKVLIWVISKEKFAVAASEIKSSELRKKVENYLKLLQSKNETSQVGARRLGRELYDLLVNPIIDQIDPARDLCVIPNKILFHLPFAALISPNERSLVEDLNIFYAPSASVFLVSTERARKKAVSRDETLLSVGNPAFDRKAFADLSDLPAAETEAREIAGFYENQKPKILLREQATKTSFLDLLPNAEIIHFAGHYVVIPNAPLSSSLLFAGDGRETFKSVLTNSELLREKMPRAKLIVLSACETGIENYYNGEGLIGLSRTFLAAGAPLVVASQWKVDSNATAALMKRFHYYRREEKLSTTNALRRAQLEMLNAADNRFREPYYWASFAVFGGYATF